MNFITMQLLDKIKASRVEAQKKNIIYRLVYKIVYKYNTKKILSNIDKYLSHANIDAEHMLDIIHTLHTFCSVGIISETERREIFTFQIKETDGTGSISYEKKTPKNTSRYKMVIFGEVSVKINNPEMHIGETIYDDTGRTGNDIYTDIFTDDKDHNFYNTIGLALLFGIRNYLDYKPHNKNN